MLGYYSTISSFEGSAAARVTALNPGSPLLASGVQVGDLILGPNIGSRLAGEAVTLRVVHDGAEKTVETHAVRIDEGTTPLENLLEFALSAFALVIGALVAMRRWHEPDALAFATIMLLGVTGLSPIALPPGLAPSLMALWQMICAVSSLVVMAYFALILEGGYQSAARDRILPGIAGLSGALVVWAVAAAPHFLGREWVNPEIVISYGWPFLMIAGVALSSAAFLDAWRHANADRRERLRWLVVGVSIGLLNFIVLAVFNVGLIKLSPRSALIVNVLSDAMVAVALLTLAYAILRHRVIDVGFAVNRAVVYGAFTGLLLVAFGVIEWFVDHVVQFDGREHSKFLDGVIALALFLTLHRLRHWLETLIERLFFHTWHAKELALQKFRTMAPHYSDPDALGDALLAAVDAFATCRGSAVYTRDAQGRFVLERGTLQGLPMVVEADAEGIVEMKTFRAPLHLAAALAPATLAFPMLRRAELAGLLVVGAKIRREVYRPDEIELLATLARQVGNDLYTLRLERQVSVLSAAS